MRREETERNQASFRRQISGNENCQPSVGKLIAEYRQRRFRVGTGEPWSQEELALASGTNQAHISRIEADLKHPQYSTLLRLCEALEMPAAKQCYLLALAGYRVEPRLPSKEEVDAALANLAPVIDSYPYPALLMDVGERIWYVNSLVAELWGPCLGGTTQAECLRSAAGRRSVQFLFDARYRHCWASRIQELGPVMDRHVFLFWRAFHLHSQDADMHNALRELRQSEEFTKRWQDLESGGMRIGLVEHDFLRLSHPKHKQLILGIWRTATAEDERFMIAHFPPADDGTQTVIRTLLRT